MSRNKTLFPLMLVFLMTFLVRMSLISKGPFHVDCLQLAMNAQKTLATHALVPLFGSGYPLTVLLGALFVAGGRFFSISDPVIAVNFMSVVFSSLCVVMTFGIARKLCDAMAGYFSAILLSFFPIFLVLSVYGKSHAPSLFFLLAGILWLLDFQVSGKRRTLVWAALSLGLMGGARLQDLILMAAPLGFLFFFPPAASAHYQKLTREPGRHRKDFFLFGAVTGGVALLLHLPIIINSQHSGYVSQFARFWNYGMTFNFMGFISVSLKDSLRHIVFGLTPVGALMCVFGMFWLLKVNWRNFVFFILWFLVPLLFYGNLTTTAPRFLVISVIPLILAQGFLWSHLIQRRNPFFTFFLGVVFLVIVVVPFYKIFPILHFRHLHALLPDFGRYVKKVTEPEARIITTDEGLFIIYYGEREILNRPRGVPAFDENELREFLARIDELLDQGIPVYVTGTGLYSYNTGYTFSKLIKKNYNLLYVGGRTTEDWHQGGTRLRTGQEDLYRLTRYERRDTL